MNYKENLIKVILALNSFYLFLNQELLFVWRKLLSKQSDNRITHFFKTMIENPTTALAINTVLFYLVSAILSGGAGLIGQLFFLLSLLNIVMFIVNFFGWIDKLKK